MSNKIVQLVDSDNNNIYPVSATPEVNDATLTIQKNGSNVATFTANASANVTANIIAPNIAMTDTDPGEGTALSANNFTAVYGGDPIIMDYSLTEVNTGATWVDGSTIYKKTITYSFSSSGSFSVNTDLPAGVTIVKMEGILKSGTEYYGIDNYSSSTNWAKTYFMGGSSTRNLGFVVGSGFTTGTFYVTLYYTKAS